MELLIIGVIVLVAIAYGLFYYWSNRKTTETPAPYKVEAAAPVTMDESFDAPVVAEVKPAQKPAKMAKPNLTKVEGGSASKPVKTTKSKAPSEQKSQKPKSKKPKSNKKPTV